MDMKKNTFLSGMALLFTGSLFLTACGGGGSSSVNSSGDTSGTGNTKNAPAKTTLEKVWETDTSVRAPESALWDSAQKILYVSNIDGDGAAKDGNGFISQLAPDGKIVKLHWVDGLDAPKGLGMYQGMLYAADLDSLVIIDMKKAKIKTKIYIPGATFLNDIAVDDAGNVYMSDTRQGKVFLYANGKISIYLGSQEMKGANGLLWKNRKLWILAADGIYTYDTTSRKLNLFSDAVKGGDGLTAVNDSDLLASRWVGEVYYVKADGSADKLLDTRKKHFNTADITFLPDSQLLVVPTFTGNTVAAYKLTR
jgi:hypothetical protein